MDAVVIMAKRPTPYKVKTRLVPSLSAETASQLYYNFLLDKIEQVNGLVGAYPFIAYTPLNAKAFFKKITPKKFGLIGQVGADLGERLALTSQKLFNMNFTKVVMLDSDTPTLPSEYIVDALQRLDNIDVAIGPCEDGGYYLIGLKKSIPHLFDNIPWSSPVVTDVTIKKAKKMGVTISILHKWYDVDTTKDLLRLRQDLEKTCRAPSADLCKNTRRFLTEIRK